MSVSREKVACWGSYRIKTGPPGLWLPSPPPTPSMRNHMNSTGEQESATVQQTPRELPVQNKPHDSKSRQSPQYNTYEKSITRPDCSQTFAVTSVPSQMLREKIHYMVVCSATQPEATNSSCPLPTYYWWPSTPACSSPVRFFRK